MVQGYRWEGESQWLERERPGGHVKSPYQVQWSRWNQQWGQRRSLVYHRKTRKQREEKGNPGSAVWWANICCPVVIVLEQKILFSSFSFGEEMGEEKWSRCEKKVRVWYAFAVRSLEQIACRIVTAGALIWVDLLELALSLRSTDT